MNSAPPTKEPQLVALRVEAFNLFNTFNWDVPDVNFSSPAFDRITSMAGTPPILQFSVRYTPPAAPLWTTDQPGYTAYVSKFARSSRVYW